MRFGSKNIVNIPADAVFMGELRCQNEVHFAGHMQGQGHIHGHLDIAHTATWRGNINSNSLSIHGRVEGNVIANGRVVIHEDGVVLGDITAPAIAIKYGAKVSGLLNMRAPDAPIALLEHKQKAEQKTPVNDTALAANS
jgi:cytoskeletal protein CcmA (bactofilin family)